MRFDHKNGKPADNHLTLNGRTMQVLPDPELIAAAEAALQRAFRQQQHTVGCAVRTGSGRIYAGVNIKACGYGPCAEPIALGAAFTAGESVITGIVAVRRKEAGEGFRVVSPCGNCRQLLVDYAPDATVVYADNGELKSARAVELLPGYYRTRWNERLANGTEEL
jgi:cytidine deaminase